MNREALKQRLFDDTDVGTLVEEMNIQKAQGNAPKMVRVSGSEDLAKILEQMNSRDGDSTENVLIRVLTKETEHKDFQIRQIKEEFDALPYLRLGKVHTSENPHWNLAIECEVLPHWIKD